jgi:DNA-binding transcriptional ArsR family regulator
MEVAHAIADPVRRQILEHLRAGPATAGTIAGWFDISRPAVSRHLRVLREHGLVVDDQRGRERSYRLEVAPLAELEAWLATFHDGWEQRLGSALDALGTEVHRTRRQRQTEASTTRPRQERSA